MGTVVAHSSPLQTLTFPEKTRADLCYVHRGLLLRSELSGARVLAAWCFVNSVLVFSALHGTIALKRRVWILLSLYTARSVCHI